MPNTFPPYSPKNPIPFPTWAKHRNETWTYAGWIKNPPDTASKTSFKEMVEIACKSDHREKREVDIYPWGATEFVQKEEQ